MAHPTAVVHRGGRVSDNEDYHNVVAAAQPISKPPPGQPITHSQSTSCIFIRSVRDFHFLITTYIHQQSTFHASIPILENTTPIFSKS